jgi:hypothetical protein
MATYQVNDSAYWNSEIKSGNINGFSLEGFFKFNKVNLAAIKEDDDLYLAVAREFIKLYEK